MKRFCALLLALVMVCTVALAASPEWSGVGYLDGVRLQSWDEGQVRNLVIPATVYARAEGHIVSEELPVTALAPRILSDENAAAVVTVTLPTSVQEVDAAFSNCTALQAYLLDGESDYLATTGGVLFTKDFKQLLAYPAALEAASYNVPDGVEVIADDAFANSLLKEITLPDTLTSVGEYAFADCALESITLPDTLTSLGKYAFNNVQNLRSVTIPGTVSEIPSFCFYGCDQLESVTIEAGVTKIGPKVFSSAKLTELTLPDGVKEISINAFADCSNLKAIHIPASVETIGTHAIPEATTIYGVQDSVAWEYAVKNGCAFVAE